MLLSSKKTSGTPCLASLKRNSVRVGVDDEALTSSGLKGVARGKARPGGCIASERLEPHAPLWEPELQGNVPGETSHRVSSTPRKAHTANRDARCGEAAWVRPRVIRGKCCSINEPREMRVTPTLLRNSQIRKIRTYSSRTPC